MLTQLLQLDLRNLHERVHLVQRPLKVLDAKRVDRDDPDPTLIAHLEDFGERLEAHVVAFDGLDVGEAREATVAVHDEGDVARDGALAEGVDEEGLGRGDGPFDGGRGEEPFAGAGGAVEG